MPSRNLKDDEVPRESLYSNWQEYIKDPVGVTPCSILEPINDEEPATDMDEQE